MFVSWLSSLVKPAPKFGTIMVDEDGLPIDPTVPKELADKFISACTFLPKVITKLDHGNSLTLYGLYKIATVGPANEADRPSWYEKEKRGKFNSWCSKSHLSAEEAMVAYCNLLKLLFPEWDPTVITEVRGWGLKPSRPMIDPEALGQLGTTFKPARMETNIEQEWFKAMRDDDVDKMRTLLEEDHELLESTDQHLGMTALARAVDLGCENVAEFLITRGANVNVEDSEGSTPLHFAAQCNRARLARLLVHYGADRDARDADGQTPSERCDDPVLSQEIKYVR